MPKSPRSLKMSRLSKGFPCISKVGGAHLANAAAVCLEERNHSQGVLISVRGYCEITFSMSWPEPTDQIRREWAEPIRATESGAVAVAILLVDALTEYHVIETAYKTTGIDYWLGKKDAFLLQNSARLEVSGIRQGSAKVVDERVKTKVKQTEQSRNTRLPVVVIVVEFGAPVAVMVMQ